MSNRCRPFEFSFLGTSGRTIWLADDRQARRYATRWAGLFGARAAASACPWQLSEPQVSWRPLDHYPISGTIKHEQRAPWRNYSHSESKEAP